MQALRNLIAAFSDDDLEEDDEEAEAGPQPLSQISVGTNRYRAPPINSGVAGESTSSTGTGSGEWSYSSSEEDDEAEEDEALNHIPLQLRGDYFARLERPYWEQERETVALVYKRFAQYSPLANCQHQHAYTELDLLGLEYLLSETGRKSYERLRFVPIYLNSAETGKVRPLDELCRDTFVVDRTLDYVYGRVLELALMHGADQKRLPIGMEAARTGYWNRRNQLFPLCRKPQCMDLRGDGDRQCHQQVVVYTRTDSLFFLTCQRVRDCNFAVDYEKHSGVILKQRISYHLVNLLCGRLVMGHNTDDAAVLETPPEVEKYDKWIVLPIEWLDLWNATPRLELNVGRDYATVL